MTIQSQIVDLPAALENATKLIKRSMPDNEYRESVLRVFANAIRFIHPLNPNCWSININREGPFLLVEHEYALYPHGQTNDLTFHVYLEKMDKTVRSFIEKTAIVKEDKKDLWSTITIQFPEQEDIVEKIWPAFTAYLQDKTRYDIHTHSIPPHLRKGAGVVEYIRKNNIDSTLPQPGYVHIKQHVNPNLVGVNLNNLVNSFAKMGLSFSNWEIATFYTALQTKGFVILSGISGMGKTKLAQAFARLMPQPTVRIVVPDDLIKITVQPYMRKYSRIIIPKSNVEFFTPPEAGESIQVKLTFSTQSEQCMLKHYQYSETDYIQLYLKGKARIWFVENFQPDDLVILEPQLNEDDNVVGFKLGKQKDFAEEIPIETNGNPDNYLFLSVRPDWRDSKSLLGYFNPIDQQYHSTAFLEFIKRAHNSFKQKEKIAWFVLLDEMNLARVEYYFSDLLSVLESGRDDEGWSRETLKLDYPYGIEQADIQREFRLPPNLYIIGTVNIDETTHAFSPKVLDRAFTMEMSHADLSNYPVSVDEVKNEIDQQQRIFLFENFSRNGKYAQLEKSEIYDYLHNNNEIRTELMGLYDRLQPYDLHFGYRVVDEVCEFLINADLSGFFEELGENEEPFDSAILMKVLPKFHGSRTKLEEPLKTILAWCLISGEGYNNNVEDTLQNASNSINEIISSLQNLPYKYPHTASRVIRMIRSIYTTGFASFG